MVPVDRRPLKLTGSADAADPEGGEGVGVRGPSLLGTEDGDGL